MNDIIHIGFHKTATTWLQKGLVIVKNATYVDPLIIGKEILLKSEFRFYNESNPFEKMSERMVISHEELSGNPINAGFGGVMETVYANRIHYLFSKRTPRIVIFIRNQYDMVLSQYLQYLKMGGIHSMDSFFNEKIPSSFRNKAFKKEYYFYSNIIHLYQNLFGKESVYIYLYEELKEDNQAFLEKLKKDLDLDIDIEDFIRLKSVNVSNSIKFNKIKRIINGFTSHNDLSSERLSILPKRIRSFFFKAKTSSLQVESRILSGLLVKETYRNDNLKLLTLTNFDEETLKKWNYL